MNYKGLIALDMDGTLLQEGFYVADAEIDALKRAHGLGYMIAIATGRSSYAVANKLEDLRLKGIIDVVIGSNGAEYLEVGNDEAVELGYLTRENIKEVTEIVGDMTYGFAWYGKDMIHSNKTNHHIQSIINQTNLDVTYHDDIAKAFPEKWIKAIMFFRSEKDAEVKHKIEAEKTGDYKAIYSHATFVELMPNGIDKGYAMFKICEKYQIDKSKTIAIGDNENDLEMIRDAGFGVAMGNALDVVKDVADYITDTFSQNGVAKAIDYYLNTISN